MSIISENKLSPNTYGTRNNDHKEIKPTQARYKSLSDAIVWKRYNRSGRAETSLDVIGLMQINHYRGLWEGKYEFIQGNCYLLTLR